MDSRPKRLLVTLKSTALLGSCPALTDASDFGTQEAWFYVTLLTIGYMVSRGLAKSRSCRPLRRAGPGLH